MRIKLGGHQMATTSDAAKPARSHLQKDCRGLYESVVHFGHGVPKCVSPLEANASRTDKAIIQHHAPIVFSQGQGCLLLNRNNRKQ